MSFRSSCFGLTGGIACGKSTVASFFRALGARTIDADEIGHEMLRQPGTAFDEIIKRFGTGILTASGEIDRKLLGMAVFSDPQKRLELNIILHPRIIKRQEELVEQYCQESPGAVVIVDAALIYEAGVEDHFAKVLVAWCAREQQEERLIAKTGISREEAARRIAAQIPAEEKRRRADFVIDCSGSLASTQAQVEVLYPQLHQLLISGQHGSG